MSEKKKKLETSKETKTTKEKVEEIVAPKEKKEKDGKSLWNRILNIVLWIVLIAWMGICLIDFYNVKTDKDPKFCLQKETTKYDDGQVRSCLGLGYKIYQYERESYKGIEFGPFWAKDRSVKEDQ